LIEGVGDIAGIGAETVGEGAGEAGGVAVLAASIAGGGGLATGAGAGALRAATAVGNTAGRGGAAATGAGGVPACEATPRAMSSDGSGNPLDVEPPRDRIATTTARRMPTAAPPAMP
jgi:hypothetical protein